MERFKKYIAPFAILVLLVSLIVIYRSFLMVYIIEPVAVLFWIIWRSVTSVDQKLYWIILILFCAILLIRFITSEKDAAPTSAYNYTHNSPNRVEYWQTILEEAVLGKKESEYLHDRLEKLFLAVVAQTKRPDSAGSGEINAKEKISLSPAAQRYLFPPTPKVGRPSKSWRLNILFLLPRRLRKRARMFIHQDNTLINEILTWMEAELEINNER
jgi:hypothetical protein